MLVASDKTVGQLALDGFDEEELSNSYPDDSIESMSAGPERLLSKPVQMTVLMPRGPQSKLTLTMRRVHLSLLQITQTRLRAMGEMPAANHLFAAPLAAILKSTGTQGNERTLAKQYLQAMQTTTVDWESPRTDESEPDWVSLTLLSEARLTKRGAETWVLWAFAPTIMSCLMSPEKWAQINLAVACRLSTYAALALYEICARYRANPSGVTSRRSVDWWIDALSPKVRETGERREWRKFKGEKVKVALDEINRLTDLQVDLVEMRSGRAIAEVQFQVRRKQLASSQEHQDESEALILRGESLGIKEARLMGLLATYGRPLVESKLLDLETRVARSDLLRVSDIVGYFEVSLRNALAVAPAAPIAIPRIQDAGGVDVMPPVEPAELDGAAQKRPGAAPSLSVEARMFARQRAQTAEAEGREREYKAQLRQEFVRLPKPEQEVLIAKAVAALESRNLMTPAMRRRKAEGEVLAGILGAEVMRYYEESREEILARAG